MTQCNWISMFRLKEERYGEYGVIEVKCKDCKLCLVKFKLELLTDIHIFQMFEKVFKLVLLKHLNPVLSPATSIW